MNKIIDVKLLRDIAPYENAYGHGISNNLYYYKYFAAHFNLSGEIEAKNISEFYERVLRSFLVTKNLTYSKRLIEKELGKASDMPSPPTELTYKKVNTVMSEVESIKLKKRQRKSMMQISIENYEYAFGEKHKQLIKSIKAIAGKKKKQVEAYIKIGGMHLCFILHIHKSHKDKLQFTVWRTNEDGTGIGDGWFSEISAAINTFPELIDAKWDTK